MKQISIYHEAPLCLFDGIKRLTDGEYALVHLLDSDEAYADKFFEDAEGHRNLILDNSAFELGSPYSWGKMIEWVEKLKPNTYIVPDQPGNMSETLDLYADWMKELNYLPGLKMGVLQGKNILEAVNCFKSLKSLGADIIGIPFMIGSRWDEQIQSGTPPLIDLMQRRQLLVEQIWDYCEAHPIHLLGVALPQEGSYYRDMTWIESVDTSNPVIHGMAGIPYGVLGLTEKRSELLADMIHKEVTPGEEAMVFQNIKMFREMWAR